MDFSECSAELVALLKGMMRSDPVQRVTATEVYLNPVITQARIAMEISREKFGSVFKASALAGESEGWLEEILGRAHADEAMDLTL